MVEWGYENISYNLKKDVSFSVYDVIVSTSSKRGNSESLIACSYKVFVYRRLFSNSYYLMFGCCVVCMMNLLQLFYSKLTALSKFTCGRKSPEGYPCSSHPSEATNLVYRRWITEDRCKGMVWESKQKILFPGHKQLKTKVDNMHWYCMGICQKMTACVI